MSKKDRTSNELMLSILSKPGGLEALLNLANIMGVDTSRKHLNTEQLKNIQKQSPDELLLSILDKPEGLDALVQVAKLGGMDLSKEEITVEKIKELLAKRRDTPSSQSSEQTAKTKTPKLLNTFSARIQNILSAHVSSLLGRTTAPNVSTNLLTMFTTILPLQNITRALTAITQLTPVDPSPQENATSPTSLAEKQIHALKNLLTKNTANQEKSSANSLLPKQALQSLTKLEELLKNKK
ncbi:MULTISPECIES: hypothetical protein [unclassified Bacillus cereus group]|uniref:hypothetical protein n=1 Tax=unclassified Bacillus cereus group TaxID=2750818 RepID=UPI001F5629A7|nr:MULTISPECIES: hypothetical protein [unclassified Bacillus cereus group]